MSNPWDVPPKPSHAPDHRDELYAAVGKALSSWELIERALAEIFSLFVGAPVMGYMLDEPAIRAYGSVISFNGRAEMLAAAAVGYFYKKKTPLPEIEKRVLGLLNECRNFSGRRNDIAHGRVECIIDDEEYAWWKGNCPCYMFLPGLLSTKKYSLSQEPLYVYTTIEMAHFTQHFEALADKLHDLWRDILDSYSSP